MSVEPKSAALLAASLRVVRGGRTLLDGVSFEARTGRVLAIVGPNGAGKSTLMKATLGLIEHSGAVTVSGRRLDALSSRERARLLAWVPQESQLSISLTAAQLVSQARYAHLGRLGVLGKADRTAVMESLDKVGAKHLARRRWQTLSGGEKRRVLLARGLATGAEILLLDEPTTSLDLRQTLRTMHLLRTLADGGKTIVTVIHEVENALRFADDCLLLSDGREVEHGPVAAVLTAERVSDVFGVSMTTGGGIRFKLEGDS